MSEVKSKEEILDKHIGAVDAHKSDEYNWILACMDEWHYQQSRLLREENERLKEKLVDALRELERLKQ
jgi:hypothetical protein